MAPHPKYASPAQILSKFQIPGSPCFRGSSHSKLNLGCFLNISSPCVPYLSCSYTNGGIFLYNFSLLLDIRSTCFLIPTPERFSCLDFSAATPLSEAPSSPQDSEIQPLQHALWSSPRYSPHHSHLDLKKLRVAKSFISLLEIPHVFDIFLKSQILTGPQSLGGLAPIALSTSLYSLHFRGTDLTVPWTHTLPIFAQLTPAHLEALVLNFSPQESLPRTLPQTSPCPL